MVTQNNYYTQEEARSKICPEYSVEYHDRNSRCPIFSTPCLGERCSKWIFHDELTDTGKRQGRCSKNELLSKK